MKLSIYTIVKDGIYLDLHVEAMLRHHLPLADEIVVNEGYSKDDTFERISRIDPKIRVFREEWHAGDKPGMLFSECKNHARVRCTGDWCILLDCDEFIPEWEFGRIRDELPKIERPIVPLRFVQFYGNYRVHHSDPPKIRWGTFKYPVHRNLESIRVVGDGSNVVVDGHDIHFPQQLPSPGDGSALVEWGTQFECHHMGQIRKPARLRQKWHVQSRLKAGRPRFVRTPGVLFDLAPHDWFDNDFLGDLRIYDGPLVKAVRDDPQEFVRDDMKLYEYLKARDESSPQSPAQVGD